MPAILHLRSRLTSLEAPTQAVGKMCCERKNHSLSVLPRPLPAVSQQCHLPTGSREASSCPQGRAQGWARGTAQAPAAASLKIEDHAPQTPTWGQKPELWLLVTRPPLSRKRNIPQYTHPVVVLCTLNSHSVTCQLFLSKTRRKERVRRGQENRREFESREQTKGWRSRNLKDSLRPVAWTLVPEGAVRRQGSED